MGTTEGSASKSVKSAPHLKQGSKFKPDFASAPKFNPLAPEGWLLGTIQIRLNPLQWAETKNWQKSRAGLLGAQPRTKGHTAPRRAAFPAEPG